MMTVIYKLMPQLASKALLGASTATLRRPLPVSLLAVTVDGMFNGGAADCSMDGVSIIWPDIREGARTSGH